MTKQRMESNLKCREHGWLELFIVQDHEYELVEGGSDVKFR